jgi:hypothetical protein
MQFHMSAVGGRGEKDWGRRAVPPRPPVYNLG